MKEAEGFRICELKNGRPVVLRREKLEDLPPGITERKLRLTPEEYRQRFHPEQCLPEPPVLSEPATVTELWQRCRPVLEQLVKESWSPLKEFSDVPEFLKKLEGWADRIRNRMATSPHRSNPAWLGQGTKFLELIVRLREESKSLAETRGVAGSQPRCPERDARWAEVQRLAKGVVAAEAALAAVEGSLIEGGPRQRALGQKSKQHEADEDGYVAHPSDMTAYVPASEILRDETALDLTNKKLKRILAENRIRHHRPRKNRLMIHLCDWRAYAAKAKQRPTGDDPAEIEQRKAAVRHAKEGRR